MGCHSLRQAGRDSAARADAARLDRSLRHRSAARAIARGTRVSRRASLPPEMTPVHGRCAICGDADWRATWRGHQEVLICWRCAVEVLPRLIADATFRPLMTPADGAHI